MRQHINKGLYHISGLLRTRVLISLLGMYLVQDHPNSGQWIVSLCGMAIGVSAIDAWKGVSDVRADK